MKKLITAIAAIATSFGLFADGLGWTSVLSDIQSKTNNLVVGYDKDGVNNLTNTPMPTVNWFADSLKTNFTEKIANYEQPELKGEAPDQCLAIDTDVKDPVLRTFSAVAKDEGVDNWKYDQVGITDHGVFIDTETTFTLFDTDPEAPSDSKILVWAKETEADADAGIEGATNLMVTCGWYEESSGETRPTNYVLNIDSVLPNGLQPETMYRLTIRADKAGDSATFRVYLNGEQLKTVALDDQDTTLDEFPSMDGGSQTLGSAGFGGTGSLKSVDLLTAADAPAQVPFAADQTYVTVTWDDKVESLTINDEELVGGGNTTTNYLITAFGQTYTMKVEYVDGYRHGTITTNDQHGVFKTLSDLDEDTVTFAVDMYQYPAITVTPELARDEATLAIWSQDESKYIDVSRKVCGSSLSAIFAWINTNCADKNVRITLGDKTALGDIIVPTANNLYGFSGTITIDLHGCTVRSDVDEFDDDHTWIWNLGTMTITDSVGGGKLVAQTGLWLINNSIGALTIDEQNSRTISFDGVIYNVCLEGDDDDYIYGTVTLLGGRYSEKPTTGVEGHENDGITLGADNELVWTDEKIDGYWQLRLPGAVVVVVPALTTGLTIDSIVTNSVPVENPVPGTYTVKEKQSVVVTYTAATGYKFSVQGETGVREATESGTITPPTVEAIPVTLTVTKGTGVESVTYTVNDDTPGETVKIGDVIKITDVTYATGYEADGTYVKDYEYTVVAADVTAGSIAWTVLAKKQTFTVTVPAAPTHTKVEVKTDDTVVDYAASYTLEYGTKVDVAYTVIDSGYTITANASTNIASLVENVAVVAPTVAEIAVTEITLDKSSVTIYVGGTSNVVATIVPAGALTQTVEWEYTALAGFATAEVEGNTLKITGTVAQSVSSSPMVIKAKVGAVEATCDVFVIAVPAVGPKSETPGAKVEEESIPGGKLAKVTLTDNTLTEVEISGLGADTTVQIPAQISEIKGLGNGNAVKVISRDGETEITAACKKTLKAETTDTYIVDLDETAKVTVGAEQIAVKPEVATKDAAGQDIVPMVIETSKVTINVKTIPGLLYKLVKKASLDAAEWTDASEWVTADAARKGLEATKTSDPASFYKIKVSK